MFTLINDCFSQNQLISLCVGVPPHRMFTYMQQYNFVAQSTTTNNLSSKKSAPVSEVTWALYRGCCWGVWRMVRLIHVGVYTSSSVRAIKPLLHATICSSNPILSLISQLCVQVCACDIER